LIAFGPDNELNSLLPDAEFFSLIKWDHPAPKGLRQSARSGDWQRTVKLLSTHASFGRLSEKRRSEVLEKPALWSLPYFECPGRASRLVAAWRAFQPRRSAGLRRPSLETNGRSPRSHRLRNRIEVGWGELADATDAWLDSTSPELPIQPIETLVLYEIVRHAAGQFPVNLASRLLRTALASATSDGKSVAASVGESSAPKDAHANARGIALEAELSWQAGLLFAPVAGSASLREAGRAGLWGLLSDATDSSGVPTARHLCDFPIWMTGVVRAHEWGRSFGKPLFSASQEKRLRCTINTIAKICRQDGSPGLSECQANGLAHVWSTAVAAFPTRLQKTSAAAQYLSSLTHAKQPSRSRVASAASNGSRRPGHKKHKSLLPVFQSDQSRLACLRSDWSPRANRILVCHQGRFPSLEMTVGGATLFAGDWQIDVRVDGQAVQPADWECVCWQSDDDGDYFELQARSAGLRIERQIFLSRTDDFAIFADALVAEANARIESTSRLRLTEDCAAMAQTRTRECRVLTAGAPVRAFPLALNWSRVEGATGHLSAAEQSLEVTQHGIGALYAPLALDWNPHHRRSPATWRRLTVAVDGAAVPHSSAAGFLLEVGPSKWLLYRSLCPTLEPRSVLGQHTMYETVMGPFVRGDLEPVIQVEQAAESDK
jgi:hypothetical protein